MWRQIPTKKMNVILKQEYGEVDNEFASLTVEKVTKEQVTCFTLTIWISYVLEISLDFYKMEDLTRILTYIKKEIEHLDETIDEMTRSELDTWKENFTHQINEY